jgi:flagellar export protein FliJ|tara:strand:- start:796 stop:1251 length:456 start_codon:yes stop_codon:yes gene_type:complete
MKPFQFSLNTVLDVRSNEEQIARAAHTVAQEALETILIQRRSVEEAVESNLSACHQAFDGQVKSGTIAHLQSALRELRAQLEILEPEVQRLQEEADAKWQALLQARQRREALDKLKEKQHAAHLKEGMRTEQNAIDEMVLLRAAAGFSQKL